MTTIQLPTGANGARILGFGAYRPRRRVTNDELAQTMDTNDEWIQARVGIAERRWAEPDETLAEMGVAAGGKALASRPRSPTNWASRGPGPSTSTPAAPAGATRSVRRPTRSGADRRATSSSSVASA
jgi:hypothetical protein